MHLSRRQKQFLAIAAISTALTICSRVNIYGLAVQSYPDTPSRSQVALVADDKQADSTLEQIGRSCLPASESAGAELIGEYKNPDTTELFQAWMLTVAQHPVLRIHGLYETTCLLAYDERYNQTIGDDISQKDARQLSLILYQYRANEIGDIDALQSELNQNAALLIQNGDTGYLSNEDIWALEEMGIQVPDVFEIYNPQNPPKITRSSGGEI